MFIDNLLHEIEYFSLLLDQKYTLQHQEEGDY